MGSLFTLLFAKISAVLLWFSTLFVAIFVAAWDIFTDVFAWLFEQVLKVVSTAVGAIDFAGMANYSVNATLPAEIVNILGLLGVGTAVTIILSAIGIRLALQLIPFVRLGS